MKKKILFIINPISGGKPKDELPNLIERHLDESKFEYSIAFTERVGHARELALDAVKTNIKIVVAVGGDGTINEIASVLADSSSFLGIIPMGSGNGLATSLGIPFKVDRAIEVLNNLQYSVIDSATLNGHPIFNVSGIGFDAQISARFARDKTRGLWGYVRNTFAEIMHYQPEWYTITIDGEVYGRRAFMISLANSTQYGNNAHISPEASLTDGLLDICVVKPFPLYMFPALAYRLFSKTAHLSKYIEIFKAKEATIERDKAGPVHLDGEPVELGTLLHVVMKPASLNVIY
ncbi:MAG: diacylglycerol/lipid kinase family protein [Sphingobacteriaceae bacterium]